MTLKPLVTIDKAWYSLNRVSQGYVGTPKLKQALRGSEEVPASQVAKGILDKYIRKSDESLRRRAWRRFIRSDWWKIFSSGVLETRRTCECCHSRGSTVVRHVNLPKHWMDATVSDVLALCSACSKRFPCDGDEFRLGPGAAKGLCSAAPYGGTPGTGIPTTPPEGVGDGGWTALSPDATGDNCRPRSFQGLPA